MPDCCWVAQHAALEKGGWSAGWHSAGLLEPAYDMLRVHKDGGLLPGFTPAGALVQEEVEEVEQKVVEAEHSRSAARRFLTRFCTPVFLEAFVLTFLAGAQLPWEHDLEPGMIPWRQHREAALLCSPSGAQKPDGDVDLVLCGMCPIAKLQHSA